LKYFNPASLNSHFKPLQLAVTGSHESVTYAEYAPVPALLGFVFCYWRLSSTVSPQQDPFLYRVVPDGCMDIFFNLQRPSEIRVMGLSSKYTEFKLFAPFDYAGIRFMPGAFTALFGVNAAELSEKDENAVDVIPSFVRRISRALGDHSQIIDLQGMLNHLLISHMSSANVSLDSRLLCAIDIVLRHKGVINFSRDIDIGVSERQLRRLFEYYVGDTPKAFSKIVRFQNFLNLATGQEEPQVKTIFLDAGYYDQAHFNKEFKQLFGLTPRKALIYR
jgi:hypothetical protein